MMLLLAGFAVKTDTIRIAILTLLLVGCESTSNKYVTIDGHKYLRNSDGSISVNKNDIEHLKGQRDIVVVDNVLPSGGLAVTDKELQLLSKDKQLLDETINRTVEDTTTYTFLIKQGSLKHNLQRLSDKYSTDKAPISLDYGDADYYVPESSIVRASSIDELLAETLASFPVFAEIQGVTFYVKQGSLKNNLVRLGEKFSTEDSPLSIDYAGGDLHVPVSELVIADSLEELISKVLSPYPVFSAID